MLRVIKSITTALFLFVLSSCSCNGFIFGPWKNPASTKSFKWMQNSDSIYLTVKGENFQPTFVKNHRDTLYRDLNIESITFKSSNGNLLNGWFLKPSNALPKVTILHLHGNSGNLFSQFELIAPLVKQGFQVFMFDYSGFGYSEGSVSKDNILIDANSALDYLTTTMRVKNTKLVIYGQSLGGSLGVVLASQRQNEIDALVAEGAFTSYKGMASYYLPVLGGLIVSQNYSAKKSIKIFQKPVLIIHSKDDKIIPFKLGKQLYHYANNPKSFYEIEGNHICGTVNHPSEIAQKIRVMVKDTIH